MERTRPQERYIQREIRQKFLLRRHRNSYLTESPRFQEELGCTGSRGGQSFRFGRGSRTTVRNPYRLTSTPYRSVQLRRGGRIADAGVEQLRWSVLGCWKLSNVSADDNFSKLGEFV